MGMHKSKYRTPTIQEMQTQGFKFQWLDIATYRMIWLDFGNPNPQNDRSTPWRIIKTWRDLEVWWHHDPFEWITNTFEDGTTLTQSGVSINFFCPWNDNIIQEKLNRKEIRCLN